MGVFVHLVWIWMVHNKQERTIYFVSSIIFLKWKEYIKWTKKFKPNFVLYTIHILWKCHDIPSNRLTYNC